MKKVLIAIVSLPLLVAAQTGKPAKVVAKVPSAPFAVQQTPDAETTKREFDQLLRGYPPTVKGVFKQDPRLMSDEQYLTPYPALAAFIGQHPEIALNPDFYLDGLGDREREPQNVSLRTVETFRQLGGDFMGVCAFLIGVGGFIWIVRTFIDYRRWSHLSKVQVDVHTKILDRFGSSEELMQYMQTPAGSKFLQSAPISLENGTVGKSASAPVSRIMLSLQAGCVFGAVGGALLGAGENFSEEIRPGVQLVGAVVMALGIGFLVSAAASFGIAWRLGLIERPNREAGDSNREGQ